MILNISVIITLIGSLAFNNISSVEKEDITDFSNINTKCLLLNSEKELSIKDFDFLDIKNKEIVKIFDNEKENIYCFGFDIEKNEDLLDIKQRINNLNYIENVSFDYIGNNGSFNDKYVDCQWAIENLKIDEIYSKYSYENKDILVGILDTGIDGNHEDLKDNINSTLSKSFCDDNPLKDEVGHGTHVAGIIGAINNNNTGIVGISTNSKLVSLKTNFYTSEIISALDYANKINLKVINFSGYNFPYNSSFKKAIENYNGLFFTIAGNGNEETNFIPWDIDIKPTYPASFKTNNMIIVGNKDKSNKISSSSNYGKDTVDIFAPGELIMSTYPNNQYKYSSGTSMAAPFVAGTAALLLEQNEKLSTENLKNIILTSADKYSNFEIYCKEGKVLNSLKAVKTAHVDDYSNNFVWHDYLKHYGYCKCDNRKLYGHIVSQGSFYNQKYANCLLCNGLASLGFTELANCDNKKYYVLPNGVIVVDNELANKVVNHELSYEDFLN